MSEETKKATAGLDGALLAAQKIAQPLGKDGYNAHHKYSFVSAEALIIEARACLHPVGLTLFQAGWQFVPSAAGGECAGHVRVAYTLMHGPSGERISWSSDTAVVPGKGRPQDKAEATSLTFNLAYTLRGLLLLPRVEPGSEMDTRDDSVPADRGSAPANDATAPGAGKAVEDLNAKVQALVSAANAAQTSGDLQAVVLDAKPLNLLKRAPALHKLLGDAFTARLRWLAGETEQ